MILIAQDTGGTTGFAEWNSERPTEIELAHLPAGEYAAWLGHRLARGDVTDLVTEKITINATTHKKGQQVLVSVELNGIARYLCSCHGVDFTMQTPGEAKGFATDRKLRACDWWFVGSDHPRDAARHAMLRLCTLDAAFREWVAGRVDQS